MDSKRKIAVLSLTVVAAVTTGHLMQSMAGPDHPATRIGAPEIARNASVPQSGERIVTAAPELAPAPPVVTRPEPLAEARAPAVLPDPVRFASAELVAEPDELPLVPAPLQRMALAAIVEQPANADLEAADLARLPDECAALMSLAPAPGGMIDIAFDAPCNPGARVLFRHDRLAVTSRTDETGALDLSLPALSVEATVTALVRAGPDVTRTITIPEAAAFDRVVVQWQDRDAFQLHAYEFGAEFGDAGHVWAGSPRQPEAANESVGGFLTILGGGPVEWPLRAEVYSFPRSDLLTGASVRLAVEAEVNPETCGREMLGEALIVRGGEAQDDVEITLSMPDCDVSGGFLVLNNLLPDLNIAGN